MLTGCESQAFSYFFRGCGQILPLVHLTDFPHAILNVSNVFSYIESIVVFYLSLNYGTIQFLLERDYVSFGLLLLQIRLSSVTFVRPTQGLKLSAIFLRRFVP